MNKHVKTFFLILFIASIVLIREIYSFEIKMVLIAVLFLILFISNSGKIFKNELNFVILFTAIILIGMGNANFSTAKFFDIAKDFLYFLKPVLLILVGYFFSRSINNDRIILKTLIIVGVFYGLYHIIGVLLTTDLTSFSIARVRTKNGLSNILEIFSLVFIILSYKYPSIDVIVNNKTKLIFGSILTLSLVLYFSRTMFVGMALITLASLGYAKLSPKGIKYLTTATLVLISLYIGLANMNLKRNSKGVYNFLYKIKIAPEEIFNPKLDLNNHAALWDHWRAYEAYCALEALEKDNTSYVFGKGFGAMVDLRFHAPLSEKKMRLIPIIHNGYVYVLFKTGIIGLLIYLYILFYLYRQSYFISNSNVMVYRNIVAGIGLYLLFTSLIITGIYNLEEITPMILGVLLYFIGKEKQLNPH